MKQSALHRTIGLTLLLPLCIWVATGALFIIKPGYDNAYQQLTIPLYPIKNLHPISSDNTWLEVRRLNTILGEHLLVKTQQGWQQLTPTNLKPRPAPEPEQVRELINDAIKDNQHRYGAINNASPIQATTNTGVIINVDWNTLTLSQRGEDTELITLLYKLHYLQWTGNDFIDGLLEIIGLSFLAILTLLGGWISLKK